jgi:signal transduction histidine kinase
VTRQPLEIEAAIYFTCVEAVQNALKHAGATAIEISVRQDGGDLRFEVRDDGAGFEPSAVTAAAGLQNMRDRIEAVGGWLAVRSAAGRSTRVRGGVPVG